MTVPTNAKTKVIETTIEGAPATLVVRRLKHSERDRCFDVARCEDPQAVHQMLRLRQTVFSAAVEDVTAGREYKRVAHPVLGKIYPVDLYDDVDGEVHDQVCRFAIPDIFAPGEVAADQKNFSTPPDGSTAVSG